MNVTVLVENTRRNDFLLCEHGLSLWLETGGEKYLFDFGQTDAFARNAHQLDVDLGQAKAAILSHGHYDHGNGAGAFLRRNRHAHIYVHEAAFGRHYHGDKYIGLNGDMAGDSRLTLTKDVCRLNDTMVLCTCNASNHLYPASGHDLTVEENGQRKQDRFFHEQYLMVREGQKRIVISGCSHKGVLNIVDWLKPDVFVGGLHLHDIEDEKQLRQIGEKLLESGAVFYTGHCTGEKQYDTLKQVMGERIHALSTGDKLTI